MPNPSELNEALQNAQKASAAIRALHFSWVELPGVEVELLLEMSSKFADQVTEYLINLSGENDEGPAMTDMIVSKSTSKACQLASLITVIYTGKVTDDERENLMELANVLSGEVADLLLEQEVDHA